MVLKLPRHIRLYGLLLFVILTAFLCPQYASSDTGGGKLHDLSSKASFYRADVWLTAPELGKELESNNRENFEKIDTDKLFPPKTIFRNIYVFTEFTGNVPHGSCIALRTFSTDFDVYSGNDRIYSYDENGSENGRSMGYAYHMISIPESSAGKSIIIHFNSVFSQRGRLLMDLQLGSPEAVSSYISNEIGGVSRSEFYYVILSGLFIFIGMILMLFFISKKESEVSFVYLGFSSIMIGTWVLLENNIITLFMPNKYITFLAGAIALQLVPIGFLGFVNEIFVPKKSALIIWLRRIFLYYAVLTAFLDITGLVSMYLTIRVFHFMLLTAIVVIIYYVKKASSRGSREAKLYLIAFSLLSACGLIDVMNMYYISLPFSSSIHIVAWAMLSFILFLIVILYARIQAFDMKIRRYNREIELKNTELQKAWEETKASRDEVAVMNKELERKVHERTKQYEDANEELTAINEELNQTMSELKKAQVQLVQSEKMASLGNLVAGVAHEINTPLATIKSNIQMGVMLIDSVDPQDAESIARYREGIEAMNRISTDALERIIEIVKNLRTFARLDEAEVKEADIHQGLDNTLALVRSQISGKIEIIKDYGDLPPVICYPGQLNQVFLNLIVNAVHAIEGVDRPGRIVLKTSYKDNKVIVSITDNGSGISPQNIQKIFDPGFTTKGAGIGTGLGLSISYNIIQKHHGSISVESREKIGTTFTIELPLKL